MTATDTRTDSADRNRLQSSVLSMARLGWCLIPVELKSKNPGTLLGTGWPDHASCDLATIEEWIRQYGNCNWGVLLGESSGIIDVEDDSPEGRVILEKAMEECGVRTPCYSSGKSIHRIFGYDQRTAGDSCSVMKAFGTEWRFGNTPAQSIMPPSVHESGKHYEWLPGLSPDDVEVARLPDEMWNLFLNLRIQDGERKKREREKKRSQTKQEKRVVSPSSVLMIGKHTSHVPAAEELIGQYEWSKLLTDQGWRPFGEDDWTRPGNDWSNARSATLLRGDDRFHVWSNSAPIDEGHYSKWRFWYQSHGFTDREQIDAAKAFLGEDRSRQIDASFREQNDSETKSSVLSVPESQQAETSSVPFVPTSQQAETSSVPFVPTSQQAETSSVLSVPESHEVEIQWPQLIDIEEPPLDRLPPDLLNGWYGEMIRAVAVSTETPIEMAAMVALGAIATATMRKYDILIEPGFRQSLNLYLCAVMEPGNRKSAVFRSLMAAIDQYERELRQAAGEMIRTAESQFQTWKRRIDDLRGKAAKAKSHEDFITMQREIESLEFQTPVVPPLPQLTADDATPESICGLLASNEERLTLSSAEPDVFDMMMGRYSSKPNLGIYLKGHDGDSHKENRKFGDPVSLSSPLLTIVVMAQPEAVEDAGQQKVLKGRGLLARILFVMPPSPVGYRDCITRPIPHDITERYETCLRRLLSVSVQKDDFDRPKARIIRMSQPAYQLWKREQLRIETDQRDGERLSAFRDWAGKFPAAIARIAGNLHAANCAETNAEADVVQLPVSTMETAILFARVIESHTLRVFGAMNTDSNRKTAIKIIKTIRAERLNEITKRDCMRADRTVDSVMEIEPAINLLIRDGYLIPLDEDKKRGRPSEKYLINPAVHLKSQNAGTWDKKDNKDETGFENTGKTNSVLSVPQSATAEADSEDDPDYYESTFTREGTR
jgi:hypothetical protein